MQERRDFTMAQRETSTSTGKGVLQKNVEKSLQMFGFLSCIQIPANQRGIFLSF